MRTQRNIEIRYREFADFLFHEELVKFAIANFQSSWRKKHFYLYIKVEEIYRVGGHRRKLFEHRPS